MQVILDQTEDKGSDSINDHEDVASPSNGLETFYANCELLNIQGLRNDVDIPSVKHITVIEKEKDNYTDHN
eukprot:Awhi_evm1s12225